MSATQDARRAHAGKGSRACVSHAFTRPSAYGQPRVCAASRERISLTKFARINATHLRAAVRLVACIKFCTVLMLLWTANLQHPDLFARRVRAPRAAARARARGI
eukprot:6176597-Pleurochrysis_carterae.AAC.1